MSRYYIASLKHTNKGHEHITWWARNHRGYTPVIGEYIGAYVYGEALDLNDGVCEIAVPVAAVEALASPEPYYRKHDPVRFYDQRGQVVNNTPANWKKLIAASLAFGRIHKPKPEAFRGKRVAFALDAPEMAPALDLDFLTSDHMQTYFVRGHVDPEQMKAAVIAYGEEEPNTFSAPAHEWWRVIPNLHGCKRWYQPAKPASRGAFKCTVMERAW